MSGKVAKEASVGGTLSLCMKIGQTLRATRAAHGDPDAALTDILQAQNLFHGRVTDIERRTEGGFARGTARLTGIEDWKGSALSLDFQNEFLMAARDGQVLVTTPDLITLVEADRRRPRHHRRPEIRPAAGGAGFPCDAKWRSPRGRRPLGPALFSNTTGLCTPDLIRFLSGPPRRKCRTGPVRRIGHIRLIPTPVFGRLLRSRSRRDHAGGMADVSAKLIPHADHESQ